MQIKQIVFFICVCFATLAQAQVAPGLTPEQVKKLQDYANTKGLKADFSKAPLDSLEYELIERRIDSIALLPGNTLKDWEFISKDKEYYLLMQATQFTKNSASVLKKEKPGVEAFLFRSYLVSDTAGVFRMFSPEVMKEMRAVRIVQSWPVGKLEEEYRGRGLNPYNQTITKVLARFLGEDFSVTEKPDEKEITLSYRSQPLYLIADDSVRLRRASGEYMISTLDMDQKEGSPDLKSLRSYPDYVLPMLHYSVDYTLEDFQWLILADVGGDFALLFIASEIPRIRLPGENANVLK